MLKIAIYNEQGQVQEQALTEESRFDLSKDKETFTLTVYVPNQESLQNPLYYNYYNDIHDSYNSISNLKLYNNEECIFDLNTFNLKIKNISYRMIYAPNDPTTGFAYIFNVE